MMKKLLLLSLILILANSCSQERQDQLSKFEGVIYQNRSSKLQSVENLQMLPIQQTQSQSPVNWLGATFKINDFPIKSLVNRYISLFDVERYVEDNSDFLKYMGLGVYDMDYSYSAFSDFQSYYYNSASDLLVNAGMGLNIGPFFSMSAEAKYSQSFNVIESNVSDYVYACMSLFLLKNKYSLPLSENNIDSISRNYMYENVRANMYLSSPKNIVDVYGPLVLVDFVTGGSLEVMYCATKTQYAKTWVHADSLEASLEMSIMSSLVDLNGETSISDSEVVVDSSNFNNINISYRVLGGNQPMNTFTNPMNFSEFSFDSVQWQNSLQDESTHVIAYLPNGSFIPIYEFIEEDNMKEHYKKYIEENIYSPMQNPQIIITVSNAGFIGKGQYVCSSYLVNRFGDKILLNKFSVAEQNPAGRIGLEVERLSEIFPTLQISSIANDNDRYIGLVNNQLELNEFDVSTMTKLVDGVTGKTYLLATKELDGSKIVYTLYNSSVISIYGFGDLLESIPMETSYDLEYITNNYRLVAL